MTQSMAEHIVFIVPDELSPAKLNDSEQAPWAHEVMKSEVVLRENVFTADDLPAFENTESCTDGSESLRNFEWSEDEESVCVPSSPRPISNPTRSSTNLTTM
jgi:hypothetical protein